MTRGQMPTVPTTIRKQISSYTMPGHGSDSKLGNGAGTSTTMTNKFAH